ncbi:hypothetical protein [Mycobacterium talmoniae]|uniref:Mammalian cell entry protein n=1 Tax=Mycobacterium talmoniae TaxID=1858794 RepID=A0A1S1NLD9_9MYCO|nr:MULTISPECIES: hypothetical protein [Mycobacterium]OHV04708.1 hypothetical protein BKN37_08725 [Mycobacterium talmoniae]PQM47649.1 hypothetical protein C1Y40_02138 [Mycobacterium talmoniae]TDH54446.1 hypothetical protein E2F47_11320 [Mycobacterium eburneum]
MAEDAEAADTAEPEDAADTDDPEVAEPAPKRRPAWVSTALTAAALAVICGLLASSAYLGWHHHAAAHHRAQTAAFAAAAKQELINLTSFNYTHAKDDVQRVLDNATGEFKDDFTKRADDFTAVVEQSKVVTEGTVTAVAVESMSTDAAVVLVSATSNVTNAAGAQEEPRAWRMRMTVTRDGDQYKVSKVEMVS